ncbi:MAG: hypothetical protein ACTHMY_28390 [Solirubrobacteraceae bacterium]
MSAVGTLDVIGTSSASSAAASPICFPPTRSTAVTPLRGYPAQSIKRRLLPGQLPVSLNVSPLPAVLSARMPGGQVIGPSAAARVLDAMWSLRERAGAQDNGPMLSRLETGAARAWDVAEANEDLDAGVRSMHVVRPILNSQVEVPYQTSFPACFLALVSSTPFPRNGTAPGTPVIDVLVFSRASASAPWRVALHTDFTGTPFADETILRDGTPDPLHPGYVAHPQASSWFPASSVYPALAAYWQHWKNDGAPPPATPFQQGTFTSGEGEYLASPLQDRVDPSTGARIHETFHAQPSADGRFEFAVRDGWDVTCSAVRGDVLITPALPGATVRQTNAYDWGYGLPIGSYQAIRNTTIRQSCAIVEPTASGGSGVLGLEGFRIDQVGTRASMAIAQH